MFFTASYHVVLLVSLTVSESDYVDLLVVLLRRLFSVAVGDSRAT